MTWLVQSTERLPITSDLFHTRPPTYSEYVVVIFADLWFVISIAFWLWKWTNFSAYVDRIHIWHDYVICNDQISYLDTATFTINRYFACLWSRIDTFQVGVELCKRATMLILSGTLKNTYRSFQMRYCMQFFLQGHQNCQNLKLYTSEFT